MPFKPYNLSSSTEKTKRKLPHWEQTGCTYFVTFRLHDAIPKSKLEDWNQRRKLWLRSQNFDPETPSSDLTKQLSPQQQKEYDQRFIHYYHALLDSGSGSCLLKQTNNSQIVADSLLFFDRERYTMGDFIVMPNHVHLLVCPAVGWSLSQLLHSWKRFSSHEINKQNQRTGILWQPESYDHIVRNEVQLERIKKYIKHNPKGLKPKHYHYHKAR
ncbi:transposase [Verrucomicrobiaceae bacterium N1E253]|uniref:Transposase n=1 Tax=Oceaniferula marina TaxID=2748318 RepID=A0A851GDX8_9BACT|nr:transposase [Oceaniferula marina]NWK55132.1 transposase [Oceaniferula marina]